MCVFMYICMYLCHTSWPNEKRPEIWYPYSHWPYQKTGFFVFSIKSPWRPLASKNCRVTWIFRISPRLPCYTFCHTFPQKILIFSYVKPRFFALKFVFLNEITKVKLFWSKWRYVYPQCILKRFSPKQI